jgi:hypothetical protein
MICQCRLVSSCSREVAGCDGGWWFGELDGGLGKVEQHAAVVEEPAGLVPAGLGVDDVGGPVRSPERFSASCGESSESGSQVPAQHLGLRTEALGEIVAAQLLVLRRGNRALSYFTLDDRP